MDELDSELDKIGLQLQLLNNSTFAYLGMPGMEKEGGLECL